MGDHEPADGLGQWCVAQCFERRVWCAGDAIAAQMRKPSRVVQRRGGGQPGQPCGIVVFAHKRFEQAQ